VYINSEEKTSMKTNKQKLARRNHSICIAEKHLNTYYEIADILI